MIVLTIFSILYIAYHLGKDDGKWGLLIIIAVIFGIALLITIFK